MTRATRSLSGACLALLAAVAVPAMAAESTMQPLAAVSALDEVVSAHWARGADEYRLTITIDILRDREKQRARAAARAPVPRPEPATPAPGFGPPPARVDPPPGLETERAAYFIGNTIANLRGLDPVFHCRTLTLVDGRRSLRAADGTALPPPRNAGPVMKDPRVQVWLLKKDETQVLPDSYTCKPTPEMLEISYGFAAANVEGAVAAAIRVQQAYLIEELQPLAAPAAVQ